MPAKTNISPKITDRSEKVADEKQDEDNFASPQRKLRRSIRNSNVERMPTPGKKRQRSETEDNTPKKLKLEDKENKNNVIENIKEISNGAGENKVEINDNDTISPLKNQIIQNEKTISEKNTSSEEICENNNNNNKENNLKEKDAKISNSEEKSIVAVNNDKCKLCGQFLENSDLIYYQGHPQNAVEEFVALINDKLVLASGDEGDISERPQTNITGFSIFDTEGHLCPIDGGLIESDVRIYMSGYLKSICCDSPDIDEESVPVKDVGPIIEWYIHGFDGGMKNCITLSTEYGEYNLLKPSADYTPLMNNLYEKIYISKVVVEYLEENYFLQPEYEDLVDVVRQGVIPELNDMKMTEEMLHKHAQFVCDQVESLETEDDEEPLVTLPCIRELIKLMGIKFSKRRLKTKINYKRTEKKAWTKATTTPLVRKTFESFFTDQLDKANKDLVLRRKRCGICEACQLPDCGECNACRAMAKFGGHGRTKKACVRRQCSYMAVEQGEESEPEDEDENSREQDKIEEAVPVKLTGSTSRKIVWPKVPVKADATKTYYDKVTIDGQDLKNGEYVIVETSLPNIPSLVARVVYMWQEKINPNFGYFHAEVFIRASDTILGEVGDPREVYLGDRCVHGAPLSSILRKAHVERKEVPKDWFRLGGKDVDDENHEDDGKTYFYEKYYDRFLARFEDLPEDPACPNEMRKHRFCPSCERKTKNDSKNIPKVVDKLPQKSEHVTEADRTEWSSVRWRDHEYKKGCGVFLKPGTFKFKTAVEEEVSKPKLEKVDESVYTEYYRKSDNNVRGSNADTGDPFCVGHVVAVTARGDGPLVSPQDIYLKVNVMRRPENTDRRFPQYEDLNLLYWTDDVREVRFAAVAGPCRLYYERNAPERKRLEADPTAFYFREAYDDRAGTFGPVPPSAEEVGRRDRGKGKGKGKGKARAGGSPVKDERPPRPLRTLDVFAGCGGLSRGLHDAGAADCRWAVESAEAAARAYHLNNPTCAVYTSDCNELLARALAGDRTAPALPEPGEVELLCGGPPCQGFSGMNRFNSRDYSNFKNSLVASYLSYCDYYRPKYFVLENVRNFVAFKRGMVLKLTLRALLAMGYQCTFGVLQAGRYGVPQTRRRLIVLAAAPGRPLPRYPDPTHVFSRRACSLAVTVDGKRFPADARPEEGAPRRTCTIGDAMSDLPEIANGANLVEMEYGSMPRTHFQRVVRAGAVRLRDHICKNMAPLVQARMSRVPTAPGSDWRDLPNVSVWLPDGSRCRVLHYRYEDRKSGRSVSAGGGGGGGGGPRGVCACAEGGPCGRGDKQENTLIPWCLPHTGNRHNHWAGLYGRVAWDGYFSTTVTDPEPMGKQGRVLHPEQHRVVSVRECARSQGFPDTYIFSGSVQDKHRQIGNAVPPPLGAALGREIVKALAATKQ